MSFNRTKNQTKADQTHCINWPASISTSSLKKVALLFLVTLGSSNVTGLYSALFSPHHLIIGLSKLSIIVMQLAQITFVKSEEVTCQPVLDSFTPSLFMIMITSTDVISNRM